MNEPTSIQIYIDEFEFVTIKKFLNLKGPVQCQVVHDNMYPILRYGMCFHIEKAQRPLKKGDFFCFWDNGQISLAILESTHEDYFIPKFLKGSPLKERYHKNYILGPITHFKIPLVYRLKNLFGLT